MARTKTRPKAPGTTPNPTGGSTTTGPGGPGGPIVVGEPIPVDDALDPAVELGKILTTRGKVDAFTVDESRLLIKLNVSAISRMLVQVEADAPHFKTAVSLTMMAHNNDAYLSVRYLDVSPVFEALTEGPETMVGREFGLGEDAFEIEDWPFKYQG